MSDFHFDFKAVQGLPYEQGMIALFKQMEDHYNANMQPQPLVFGGFDPAKLGGDKTVVQPLRTSTGNVYDAFPEKAKDLIRVNPDYEIKQGVDLGLKDGFILTGVTDKGVEIFDYLKNYKPGDTVVEGDSGKYDLGKAK